MASRSGKASQSQKELSGVSGDRGENPFERTALVVAGMHRSGTSAIARLLGQTGARLPNNLLPPRSSNQAGFWESKPLVTLHDKVLAEVRSSWDDVSLKPGFWEKENFDRHRDEISKLIESEIEGSSFFVLKDPRISRFMPFTVSILQSLKIEPRFVIAVRNPLAVAASLERRDGFSAAKSLPLWLDYSLQAEYSSRQHRRCFVHYERLVSDWRTELEKLATKLDISTSKWSSEDSQFADSFITSDLLHHSFSDETLGNWPGIPNSMGTAYRAMLALYENPGDKEAQALLDEIRENSDRSDVASHAPFQHGPTIGALYERFEYRRNEADRKAHQIQVASRQLEEARNELRRMADLRERARVLDEKFQNIASTRHTEAELLEPTRLGHERTLRKLERLKVARQLLRRRVDALEARLAEIKGSWISRLLVSTQSVSHAAVQMREKVAFARQLLYFSRVRGLGQARGLLKNRRLIYQSSLFWKDYYLNQNDDVRFTGVDPLLHYLLHGAEESRNPNPLFDSRWYLDEYRDVANSLLNPLIHYIRFGATELRDPGPLFSTRWYLSENPDVESSGVNPLAHYLLFGAFEGRDPNPLFDTSWYLEENPDVAESGINPLVHFHQQGWREGRDPSERFDVCYYLENNRDVAATGIDPLVHYLRIGKAEGRAAFQPSAPKPIPYTAIGGKRPRVEGWKTILLVAHFVSERLFGAERSFLDLLDGLSATNVNIIAALPKDISRYTEAVCSRCSNVVIFEYDWWKNGCPVSGEVIQKFESIISNLQVDAVHVNTIMLREPLVAGSNCGVASVVHVRELIRDDRWLTEAIGESPEQIINQVLATANWVIANSEATKTAFEKKSGTFVIPNPVDLEALDVPNIIDSKSVRFGLISSNIRKKGIEDLVELARLCLEDCPNALFVLVGPETRLIRELHVEQSRGDLPENIEFAGYADSPKAAIEQVNVVLNFSHFKESFGRTVIEAMAARRPTVAYDWGALPELVVDGVTGFLVPYRKPAMAVPAIKELCSNVHRIVEMGAAARSRAEQGYSKQRYAEQLRHAYLTIFNQIERTEPNLVSSPNPSVRDRNTHSNIAVRRKQGDVSVIVPNYNYAAYLPERLRSILDQSILPREIIFIDDASQDDSVEVARPILEQSGIPFAIEVNTKNVGPYANWRKGLSLAQGNFVWIAEADDSCERDFLETVLAPTEESDDIVISYAQSRKIDGAGNTTTHDSLAHTDDISSTRWKSSYVEVGVREVVDALAYRNTIPNVSACVLKRTIAVEASGVLGNYRYCGDWAFYARMLRKGRIAYNNRSLNAFRRHVRSQTRRTFKSSDFIVEVAKVRESICRDFPVRLKQFPRMNHFLNKDYPVESINTNTSHAPVARIIELAAQHAKNRKLIAFITTNNGSYTGGSEVLWREAALALRKAGNDIVVLIKKWEPAPDFFREFESAGIKLYFKEENGFDTLLQLDPDLAIVSTGDQDEGTEYFCEFIKRDLKYVIVNQLTKEERFWAIRKERQDAVRAGYTNAARVFFTCRNNHRVMESRLRTKLESVDYHFNPFHINRNQVPPFPDSSQCYRIAVPSKLLYIHKGQDLLIEVLAAEKWRKRPIQINLYGVGNDRSRMEKSIDDLGIKNLEFRGRVSDISEIWKDNHAILMPSRMEGLPIMLVSAMLSARVPIVTDIGGHAELVEDGVCGFIASNPDAASIDEAMEKAWAVRDDWRSYGERARERVLDFLPDDPVADFLGKLEHVTEQACAVQAVER